MKIAQERQRNNSVQMSNKQGMTFKWVFVLLFAWTLIVGNVRGQTETEDEDDDALGNIYVAGFEEICAIPIQENEECYSTSDETGSNCLDERIEVLTCSNNCASVFESITWCIATGGDCTFLVFDWIQCSYDYCASTYLSLYGQCVEKQREMNQCSSCPFLATASGELLTFPPTCSVFEEDYCAWQSCCEPCQFFLNFYGECMQVNFGSCNTFFEENPDLPTCPILIPDALPPPSTSEEAEGTPGPTPMGDPPATNSSVLDDTSSSTNSSSDLDYSRMTWLSSVVVLLLSCLLME
jgi:hypothetical protein